MNDTKKHLKTNIFLWSSEKKHNSGGKKIYAKCEKGWSYLWVGRIIPTKLSAQEVL